MKKIALLCAMLFIGLLLQAQIMNSCPDEPIVTYHAQTYNAVLVGNKCWFKENLNVGTMILSNQDQANNGVIEKYCYEDLIANCDIYGGFYRWSEAMQYETDSILQGICPSGWHISMDDEWKMLEGDVDSQHDYGDPVWDNENFRGFDAGKNLKALQGWDYNGNGTDLCNVSVLPGGHFDVCGSFFTQGKGAYYWTSTTTENDAAWYRLLINSSKQISRQHAHKKMALAIRCVKDYNSQPPFACGTSTINDDEGHVYNTVQIGGQCWMKENLNIGIKITSTQNQSGNNGIYEKYCYNNLESNCNVYGGSYQWSEFMQGGTLPGSRGICPEGWHVPTKPDFEVLVTFLGGPGIAGRKLKESGTAHWVSPNTGTNESGFTGLGGGYRHNSNGFSGFKTSGVWTTSTLYTFDFYHAPWVIGATYNLNSIEFGSTTSTNGLNDAYSVRCLKD